MNQTCYNGWCWFNVCCTTTFRSGSSGSGRRATIRRLLSACATTRAFDCQRSLGFRHTHLPDAPSNQIEDLGKLDAIDSSLKALRELVER
jgi:hypothetical protein